MPTRFRLDNGLTVVFQEEHASRVAAFQLWVQAGSADERADQAGLAHLHEHMLFKGTERRGVGQVANEVEAHGGEINAWTSTDQTVYHVVLASRFARVGLDVLSDAVRGSLFEAGELAREIEVVCEEIKRSEDSPQRRLWKDLVATTFRVHPYRLPVLGTPESVRSFTREKVREFYTRHYAPENVVLAAAGDLSEEQVRGWAEEFLGGDWGRSYPGRVARPVEPPSVGRHARLHLDDVKEVYLHLAFPCPAASHPDVPALDALGVVLGQGQAARLSLEIKRKRSLVNDISAYAYTMRDAGLFMVSLTLPPDSLGEALEETGRVLGECARSPLAQAELIRAQRLIESDSIYAREVAQGLARKLGFYETVLGGYESEARYHEAVAALSPESVAPVASRTLDLSRVYLSALLPKGTVLSEEEAFTRLERGWARAMPPIHNGAEAKPPVAPSSSGTRPVRRGEGGVVIETLSSGMRVLVREEHAVPLFALRIAARGGSRLETDADAGVGSLLARMMTRGTPTRDAEEISRQVDGMAGGLGALPGRNSLSVRGEFLSRHFEEAFELFADVVQHPTFPEKEFVRERKLALQHLLTREDRPAALAFELFAKALYPTHPYRLPVAGEPASLEALNPDILRSVHRRQLQPGQLHLAVVGDVDAGRVIDFAERAFSKSGSIPVPLPNVAPPMPLSSPQRLVQKLARAQTHLVVGFLGARLADPWRYALDVLTNVLSGMGGRLFLTLRDQQSLAYSVSAQSMEGVDPGYFAIYMGTSPEKEKEALAGIHLQLDRICEELISAPELERAKENLVGGHEIGLQRAGARAALIALDDCYGLGLEGFLRYAENVSRVSVEEVREVARRVIRWEQSALAVVGPS